MISPSTTTCLTSWVLLPQSNYILLLNIYVSTLYVYHPTGQWNSKMHFITILWNKLSICRYNIHLCCRLACWADYEHTIQVESGNLQSQQIPGVPSHHKPVQALIIFKTHPIRLMASMIIDKHVRPLSTAGNIHCTYNNNGMVFHK